MIDSADLCRLLGKPYAWLDARRRRARQLPADQRRACLPLIDIAPHARHDTGDALRVAIALQAEAMGATFEAGARLAINADIGAAMRADTPDSVWVWCVHGPDGTKYGTGPFRQTGAATMTVNVSHVLATLQARAEQLGLADRLRWPIPERVFG